MDSVTITSLHRMSDTTSGRHRYAGDREAGHLRLWKRPIRKVSASTERQARLRGDHHRHHPDQASDFVPDDRVKSCEPRYISRARTGRTKCAGSRMRSTATVAVPPPWPPTRFARRLRRSPGSINGTGADLCSNLARWQDVRDMENDPPPALSTAAPIARSRTERSSIVGAIGTLKFEPE